MDRHTIGAKGDDIELVEGHQRRDAIHGLLEHGALAGQAEELLGVLARAQWPQSRATAASQNRRIHQRTSTHENRHTGRTQPLSRSAAPAALPVKTVGPRRPPDRQLIPPAPPPRHSPCSTPPRTRPTSRPPT